MPTIPKLVMRRPRSASPAISNSCPGRTFPTSPEGLLHAARAERMFPGEGGIDLVSLVRAIPADVPITLEIPAAELARTVGPLERARRAVARTHELLALAATGRGWDGQPEELTRGVE